MTDKTHHPPDTSEVAIIEPVTESAMSPLFGDTAGNVEVHSFNMNDATESMLYVNAVGGESQQIKHMIGQVVDVVHYYCRAIQFAAEKDDPRYAEGEVINGLRCVLVDKDGNQYHTTSPTAIKTIAALHKTALGKKRFNPPIRLRIGIVKSRGAREANTLTVVPPEVDKKKPE